jgi:hypothetical protein
MRPSRFSPLLLFALICAEFSDSYTPEIITIDFIKVVDLSMIVEVKITMIHLLGNLCDLW